MSRRNFLEESAVLVRVNKPPNKFARFSSAPCRAGNSGSWLGQSTARSRDPSDISRQPGAMEGRVPQNVRQLERLPPQLRIKNEISRPKPRGTRQAVPFGRQQLNSSAYLQICKPSGAKATVPASLLLRELPLWDSAPFFLVLFAFPNPGLEAFKFLSVTQLRAWSGLSTGTRREHLGTMFEQPHPRCHLDQRPGTSSGYHLPDLGFSLGEHKFHLLLHSSQPKLHRLRIHVDAMMPYPGAVQAPMIGHRFMRGNHKGKVYPLRTEMPGVARC
jgi:hypothetical protein